MRYTIVIEKTRTGFSAYAPDVPGCVAAGRTQVEVRKRMAEALDFHLEGLQWEGLPIPQPSVKVERLHIPVHAHAMV